MKKVLVFGFLLMGFTFTVTQGLLIRELPVVFFSNELAIGLILRCSAGALRPVPAIVSLGSLCS